MKRSFQRPQLIRDEVYAHLREQIIIGELQPGHWLRELELSESLEVSRTPIRDALNRMVQEGLLENSSRGVRVRRYSLQEAIDIYEVRELLESRAASLAAQRYEKSSALKLDGFLKQMATVEAHDIPQHTRMDLTFHSFIAQLSGNEALVDLIERLTGRLISLRALTGDKIASTLSREQHEAIVDAIKKGDEVEAAKAMSIHVTHFKHVLDERIKERCET